MESNIPKPLWHMHILTSQKYPVKEVPLAQQSVCSGVSPLKYHITEQKFRAWQCYVNSKDKHHSLLWQCNTWSRLDPCGSLQTKLFCTVIFYLWSMFSVCSMSGNSLYHAYVYHFLALHISTFLLFQRFCWRPEVETERKVASPLRRMKLLNRW